MRPRADEDLRVVPERLQARLKFPLFPSPEERRRQGLKVDTKDLDGVIRLTKPDTGVLVQYLFKKGDCWKLVAIEDSST